MIDFSLSEEEESVRSMVRDFARKEVSQRAMAVDRDPDHVFDWEIVRRAAELGFMGLLVPEEYGGTGMPLFCAALAMEELAYGDAGVATTIGLNWALETMIMLEGNPGNFEKYLPVLTSKEGNLAAIAITESVGGSDTGTYRRYLPGTLRTLARKDGDSYVINGTKTFITNGGLAKLYLVLASLERGGSADQTAFFYVPAETPGFSAGKVEDKMGQRASQTAEVILEDVVVPAGNLYGEAGAGLRYVEEMIYPLSRASVGCISLGIARAAYDHALDYAAKRVQGGKPIIEHQAIAMKLANMATAVEAARSLAWKATWANIITMGREFKMACMSKVFCSEVAERVTLDAIQVLGGYGYMRDHPVEKLFRDAKLTQIYECTNDMNLLDIASMINP